MTPEHAAWVRANAWTESMRRALPERDVQRYLCACLWGPSGYCETGQCEKCTPTGRTFPETYIAHHGGVGAAFLPIGERPAHPRQTINGPEHDPRAVVWRAQGACHHMCTCKCHAEPKAGQLDLF